MTLQWETEDLEDLLANEVLVFLVFEGEEAGK